MAVLFVLIGLISGILGAMGLGGGTILIPLLSLISIAQKNAQVINVFSFIVMSFFVLGFNIKSGLTQVFPAIIFSIFGIISAILTSLLVKDINNSTLKIMFGIFLLIIAVFEIFSFLSKYKSR